MSDKARQLAAEVNKREADQQVKDQLQLHKAEVLRAKGFDFWNNFAIAFREEVTDFNSHLQNNERRIETFDDRTTPFTIKLHANSGASATCVIDIEGQNISLTGQRPGSDRKLHAVFALVVDSEDKIQIRSGTGVVTELDVALEVLKFFAQ